MLKRYTFFCFIFFLFLRSFADEELNSSNIERLVNEAKKVKNPTIFYNLGIYYYSTSNYVKSYINFKKAFLLSPDKKTKEAFKTLSEKLDIQTSLYEPSIIEKIFSLPFNFISLNGITLLGIILFSLGCFLIFIYNLPIDKIAPFGDKKIIIGGIIALSLGLIYLFGSIAKYNYIFDKKAAIVLEDSSIYDSARYDAIEIEKLNAGTECKIIGEEGDFFLINTAFGKEGYAKKKYIERLWE